jgi:OOP family OmpA-OmpF porin
MKRLLTTLAMLSAFTLPVAVHAEGGYLGVSFGSTEVDFDALTPGAGTTLDDEDSGYKIYGGYNLNENFALEGGYVDFGESTLTAPTGAQFTLAGVLLQATTDINVTASSDAFTFAGVGKMDVGIGNIFGKLGLAMWDSETTSNIAALNTTDDGTDLFFGFGIDIGVTEALVARFEYEMYELDDDEVDMMSLGLHVAF